MSDIIRRNYFFPGTRLGNKTVNYDPDSIFPK